MREFKWMAINGIFGALIYFGYALNVGGAKNVALLFAWYTIVMSLFLLNDKVRQIIAQKERAFPRWVNISYDICVAAAFAWYGSFVTAAFWLIHLILVESAYNSHKEE
jgi:hypothetical protein